MRYAFATCDVTLRLYLRALLPAASAALVMAAAVLAVDVIAADAISLGALLAAKIIVGAATYLGLVGYFHGDRLRRALSLVRTPQPEETPSLGGPSTAEPRPPA